MTETPIIFTGFNVRKSVKRKSSGKDQIRFIGVYREISDVKRMKTHSSIWWHYKLSGMKINKRILSRKLNSRFK